MGIERAEVFSRITSAFKAGQSAAEFFRQMREQGLGYRTSEMYADWYSKVNILAVEGALSHIRKDYYPTEKTMASVEWEFKANVEYMYKVRVMARVGKVLEERFVNIMSDIALTPAMVEQAAEEVWSRGENYTKLEAENFTAWTAYRTSLI